MDKEELLQKWSKPVPVGMAGFIRLVDVLGDDSAIVRAARTSYGKGTKTQRQDEKLIRYLMKNRHTSPFEMCEIVLHIKVPIYVARQWFRHRTASINEYSNRYSLALDEFESTAPEEWRKQSTINKQGSGSLLILDEEGRSKSEELSLLEEELYALASRAYEKALFYEVAREQARKLLPVSLYTEAYWKIDLHNLLHFLSLRMHPHAQLEIRQFAHAIADIVKDWVPATYQAFLDYRINAVSFSRMELEVLRDIMTGELDASTILSSPKEERKALLESYGLSSVSDKRDFITKLKHLTSDDDTDI